MKRLAIALASVVLGFSLVACGSDGGQASPTDDAPDQTYNDGERGVDKHIVETYDSNVEIQAVVVDGTKCIIATRNDRDDFKMQCDFGGIGE